MGRCKVMEEEITQIKKDIKKLQVRNERVEADKAWETSVFRVVLITLITYIIAVIVMVMINVDNAWLNALIPTVGFYLSTQSLPIVKKWWVNKYLK